MQLLHHLCGQLLERGTDLHGAYYQLTRVGDAGGFATAVECCPRCNESLSDTDMLDGTGVPISIEYPSNWSIRRRAALSNLAAAGYALHWEDGQWHIHHGATAIAFADTLDVLIALGHSIRVQDSVPAN
jgi:hypothetical protein